VAKKNTDQLIIPYDISGDLPNQFALFFFNFWTRNARKSFKPSEAVVLNLFAERSQIQTYKFVWGPR